MSRKEGTVAPLKYSSLDDLKKLYTSVNLTGQDPRKLIPKLDLILKKTHERQKLGEEEEAFVSIMKYLGVVDYIQKSKEYLLDSKYYKDMIGPSNVSQAINLAENLSNNLKRRYDCLKKPEVINVKDEYMEEDIVDKNDDKQSTIPAVSLFNLLRDGTSKVLIIDTRHADEFESGQIKEHSVINIPQDIIQPGQSAHVLQQSIPEQSKKLWSLRGTYDRIVLMDTLSNIDNLSDDSKIMVLKNIMNKWDINTKYKNEIMVLDGGFEEWCNTYPWNTTNPHVKRSMSPYGSSLVFLEEVTYPDLDTTSLEEEILKPFIDRSVKPEFTAKPFDYDAEFTSVPPAVDRAKKAAALKTYDERKELMADLLKQKEQETSEAVELEKSRLSGELKLNEYFRKQKEEEANEEQRQIIEEQERQLFLEMEKLKEESLNKDSKIQELQRIIDIYEKGDINDLAKKQADVERQIDEEEINKKIKLQEEEKERLEKEREKAERDKEQERKKLEEKLKDEIRETKELKRKLSPDENDEKFLVKKIINTSINRPLIDRTNKPRIEKVIPQDLKERDFAPVRSDVIPGLTGLRNLGNTCYMNSIMQCISHNNALAKYFLTKHYLSDLNKKSVTRGEIALEVAAVVRTLWSGCCKSIACKDLKYTVGCYKPEYRGYEQQDSHEFLTFLMDWLHSDLNQADPTIKIENKKFDSELEKALYDFKLSNASIVSTLFYGIQRSTVRCLKCRAESATYEPFSNLSLILPDDSSTSLDDCLSLYLRSELISGWKCPRCQDFRDAEKKTDICRLPPILVIHLKRFHYIDILSRKRTTNVFFPLNDLNMQDFVQSRQKYGRFHLYAVSNHYGTMEGGHYTAYCKNMNRWYKFDDHDVSAISPSDVRSSAAYILFYSAISVHVPESG